MLPREITAVHAIEVTSKCSLRCVYCPSPQIMAGKFPNRPAVHMDKPTFLRSLEWVRYFVRRGTQRIINLSGIGEPMMHPEFIEYAQLARDAIGPFGKVTFPTNGLHVTPENAKALAEIKAEVWVSLHRPEKAESALRLLREAGVDTHYSLDPVVNPND